MEIRIAVVLCMMLAGAAEGADAQRGKTLYEMRCVGCHSLDAHRVGPAHRGVFGRKAGAAIGYDYSLALAGANILWNERTLDRWLTDPEKLIPGQRMNYSVPEPADRADLIAYLRDQSKR